MAATKTARALYSGTPAATASADATEWNLSTAYGGFLTIVLTNGSSAPTTAPTFVVYTGDATGVKRQLFTASGDTTASSVNSFSIAINPAVMFVNVHVTSGATNGTAFVVEGQELTSV
jgi:hypothetical protein